jgi:hypothetical protein
VLLSKGEMVLSGSQSKPDYPRTRSFAWSDDDDIDRLRKAAYHAGVALDFGSDCSADQVVHVTFPDAFSVFAFLRLAKRRNPRPHLFKPVSGSAGGIATSAYVAGVSGR